MSGGAAGVAAGPVNGSHLMCYEKRPFFGYFNNEAYLLGKDQEDSYARSIS
jgi:hypothetical protein